MIEIPHAIHQPMIKIPQRDHQPMIKIPQRDHQPMVKIAHAIKTILLGVLLLTLTACNRVTLKGEVFDVTGQALPGVAIHVLGTDAEGLTNARGEYTISCAPGPTQLSFFKSGYAEGRRKISAQEPGAYTIDDQQLWRLPQTKGIYIFDEGLYHSATWVEPTRFFLTEGDIVYGTLRKVQPISDTPMPFIVSYSAHRYDAYFSRLRLVDAKRRPSDSETTKVWVAGGTTKVTLTSMDEVDGLLYQIQLREPLESGVYAVHWGALDGYTTVERRVYLFAIEVPEPDIPIHDPEAEIPDGQDADNEQAAQEFR